MTAEYYEKMTCRLCNSRSLGRVIELTPTPPANSFVPAERLPEQQELYPLVAKLCNSCHHLQLGHVVDPAILFRRYVYVSGTSEVFREHFRLYCETMTARASLKAGDFVLDIGSNDGTLLRYFKKKNMSVLGVDPAID